MQYAVPFPVCSQTILNSLSLQDTDLDLVAVYLHKLKAAQTILEQFICTRRLHKNYTYSGQVSAYQNIHLCLHTEHISPMLSNFYGSSQLTKVIGVATIFHRLFSQTLSLQLHQTKAVTTATVLYLFCCTEKYSWQPLTTSAQHHYHSNSIYLLCCTEKHSSL